MNLMRILSLPALCVVSTVGLAQTCPSGVPPVAPDSRYSIDAVAGVVTDLSTGLMWTRCSEGQSGADCTAGTATNQRWTQALTLANSANYAGFEDWRLPNAEELFSLVETGCWSPSINTVAFPNTPSSSYWSSTTFAPDVSLAWSASFNSGSLNASNKVDIRQVRLVRGGQQGFDTFESEGDSVPDAFTIAPQADVPLSSELTSDPVAITGLTTVTGIGVSGAVGSSYSINGGPFTSQPGAVANTDVVRVRHTSAASYGTATITALSVGGLSTGFASRTITQQTIRLNDTGQTTCYRGFSSSAGPAGAATGTVSPGTPDPEEPEVNEQDCTRGTAAADALGRMVKMGASAVPGRDYTKIANDGSELPASAALGSGAGEWACTRDNITGLIWEIKSDDNGLRDKDWGYTWYDTNAAVNGGNPGTIGTNTTCNGTLINCNTTAYRDTINTLSGPARLCGASDWRLPAPHELSSLIYMAPNAFPPHVDTIWFPNTPVASYWTAATVATPGALGNGAWVVRTNSEIDIFGKQIVRSVRLVRGGQ